MTRMQIIDAIDEEYNTSKYWDVLGRVMESVTGVPEDEVDDNDPEEGMYADISTGDLQQILDMMDEKIYPAQHSGCNWSNKEYALLVEAMKAWADPSFSHSTEDSIIAKHILRRLGG